MAKSQILLGKANIVVSGLAKGTVPDITDPYNYRELVIDTGLSAITSFVLLAHMQDSSYYERMITTYVKGTTGVYDKSTSGYFYTPLNESSTNQGGCQSASFPGISADAYNQYSFRITNITGGVVTLKLGAQYGTTKSLTKIKWYAENEAS